MSAGNYTFNVFNNEDFLRHLRVFENDGTTPVDLTGSEIKAAMRHLNDVVEMTTDIVTPEAGLFTVAITQADIATLAVGKWHYDIVIKDSLGAITNELAGDFNLKAGVVTWP